MNNNNNNNSNSNNNNSGGGGEWVCSSFLKVAFFALWHKRILSDIKKGCFFVQKKIRKKRKKAALFPFFFLGEITIIMGSVSRSPRRPPSPRSSSSSVGTFAASSSPSSFFPNGGGVGVPPFVDGESASYSSSSSKIQNASPRERHQKIVSFWTRII